MVSCLGPFCGRFPNIHQDDEAQSSEEEDAKQSLKVGTADHTMTAKADRSQWPWSEKMRKMKKRRQQRQQRKEHMGGRGGAGAGRLKWGQYESQITVQVKRKAAGGVDEKQMQTVTQIKAVGVELTLDMLRSIPRNRVHTLILNKCHRDEIPPNLNELEDLRVLQMSGNRLTKLSEDLRECEKLERIILDDNEIQGMPMGIFKKEDSGGNTVTSFRFLEVLNLANNNIGFLPKDFVLPSLQHLDLSNNHLESLPDGILESKDHLQSLEVSHNRLVQLPGEAGGFVFPNMRKLFVSFNLLEHLPVTIGECKELRKIRMVENKVRELPESILKLWEKLGGHLEEFLVDRNPLVKPSITAFHMESAIDGVNRAFDLFSKEIEVEKERKKRDEDKVKALGPPPMDAASKLAKIPEDQRSTTFSHGREQDAASESDAQKQGQNAGHGNGNDYYFAFYTKPDEIMQVRNAESALLLRKKTMHIEERKEEAKRRLEKAEKAAGTKDAKLTAADEKRQRKLRKLVDQGEEDFGDFVVRVTDLDIYFSLLVMTSKPMFSMCQTLFDKFETTNNSGKGGEKNNTYMHAGDWGELCTSVLVNMPEEYVTKIWDLLAWKQTDRIYMVDFVAGWHIHDLASKDIWLKRICKVLNLAFYDMEPDDLEDRLRARGAQDATPQLDFEKDSSDELEELLDAEGMLQTTAEDPNDPESDRRPAGQVYPIAKIDGERRVVMTRNPGEAGPYVNRSRRSSASSNAGVPLGIEDNGKVNKVSMSDQEYLQYVNNTRDEGDAAADEADRVSSSVLSESDSQDSDFEARHAVAKTEAFLHGPSDAGFIVDSDAKLRQLMEIPVDDFPRRQDESVSGRQPGIEPTLPKKKRRKKRRKRIKDTKFETDVFSVRQAVREAYRNMPYDDFVKLVNFLLRGLQAIKHPGRNSRTYWHADDPTFKYTMGPAGRNAYTRRLLEQMGFVMLNDIYWVWPERHFNLESEKERAQRTWGYEKVPPKCPGQDAKRLDDMILLLRLTQRSIHKDGREHFRGHFRGD
mmetsp:Transcript_48188/g.108303  ORF Transcript_48188/g.108303 Transcript_48188/m.108303 type:complete len:1031 (+) Transcript_48188:40-3132(+)